MDGNLVGALEVRNSRDDELPHKIANVFDNLLTGRMCLSFDSPPHRRQQRLNIRSRSLPLVLQHLKHQLLECFVPSLPGFEQLFVLGTLTEELCLLLVDLL